MKVAGKVVLITGAASGIGAGLARRFVVEGAAGLVLGDVQLPMLHALADELRSAVSATGAVCPVHAQACDVTREADIQALVATAQQAFGRIDLCCSNAGLVRDGGEEAADADWLLNWNIHVMAHVWLARAVVPTMLQRGEGHIMITASAAGLLTSLPSSSYAVTKHASIAFAETLAIRHGSKGLGVSVLCPQAVDTPLIRARANVPGVSSAIDGVVGVEALCDSVIEAFDQGKFLILPHPQVLEYFQRKANDYDRWLGGMRRLNDKLRG
jgi:NAD(P)-dependent dehydrogenase (short-subunit alcohol dehydrogenase family)